MAPPPLYGALGPPAAFQWSPRPTDAEGPPHELRCVLVGCVVPTTPVARRHTVLPGFPASSLLYTTGSTCAPSQGPQCAPPMRSWSCVR